MEDHGKNSYERRVYESVDNRNLSKGGFRRYTKMYQQHCCSNVAATKMYTKQAAPFTRQ